MSIVNDLLAAADALEKTASETTEVETTPEVKAEITTEVETTEKVAEVTPEQAIEKVAAEAKAIEKTASKKDIEAIQEELGIDEELAEKVASADPAVLALVKSLNQEPAESMGGESEEFGKTASVEDEDPFGDFLATPV